MPHRYLDLIELLDEYGAFLLEAFDDIAVVHDLVTHIDRRAEAFERLLDGLDGPHTPAQKPRGEHKAL